MVDASKWSSKSMFVLGVQFPALFRLDKVTMRSMVVLDSWRVERR